MRVLFDLVHPADALFFHHAIAQLRSAGNDVFVASRNKDVLVQLLDDLGTDHSPISTARSGLVGQAVELASRDLALLRLARRFRPDVMVGFGGVAIAQVGKLLGTPSIAFYDTEHAPLQISLTLPLISEWHVPRSWKGRIAPGRTFRFAGSKQFAYLHPNHFQADRERALSAGWDPERDNFLIRTVAWDANHDHGRAGIPSAQLRRIVDRLARLGKVHISAEGELPPDLQPLRFRGPPSAFHHLLAHCRLHCGESITVASEAVALGVPTLLQIDKDYGYVAEQEEAGLIWRFGPDDDAVTRIDQVLRHNPEDYRARAHSFAAEAGDLNRYIYETVGRAANSRSLCVSARRAA